MPISSGALGWPKSYWSQPPDTHLSPRNIDLEYNAWDGSNTQRSNGKHGYVGGRPGKTRKGRNAKFSRSIRRRLKNGNIVYVGDAKGEAELKKKRRRRLCCLFWMLLLMLLLLAVLAFLLWYFLHGQEEQTNRLPPGMKLSCDGTWRKQFLAFERFDTKQNKTVYECCYKVVPSVWKTTIQQGDVWPDGYVINKTDCTKHGVCHDVWPKNPEKCVASHLVFNTYFLFIMIGLCISFKP